MSADVRPSTTEPIVSPILVDSSGSPLTGQTGVVVTIVDPITGQIWDWNSSSFSATPTTPTQALAAVNATYVPGLYATTWAPSISGVFIAYYDQSPRVATNLPAQAELRVGQVAFPGDAMDLVADAVDSAAVAASAVSEIQSGLATSSALSSVANAVAALPSAAAIADAVIDEALSEHTTADTLGAEVTRIRQHATNRREVDTTGGGRERLFGDDGSTVIETHTLADGTGGAITLPAGSPARRGAAT